MSDIQSLKGFRERSEFEEQSKRLDEKRRSLEEKTRVLEENARMEKLAIDKKLLAQILQEENNTHDAAIRELEEKIATLDLQMRPTIKNISRQKLSEPVQKTPEPIQETQEPMQEASTNVDTPQEKAQELPEEPWRSESETPLEAPKKKKRGLF